MSSGARLTFFWRSRAVDVVEIPALDAVNNVAFVSIRAPGWINEEAHGGALTILDDAGQSYALDVEVVQGRGPATTLNGYVRRLAISKP